MNRENVIAIASKMTMSQTLRIVCCKPNSATASITKTPDGILFYCYRCKTSIFIPRKTPLSYKELKELNSRIKNMTCELPYDYTLEIPEDGLSWLVKYGIHDGLRCKFKIGWSNYLKRVILPVFNKDDKLMFIQARTPYPEVTPKYINRKSVDKPVFQTGYNGDVAVITEDILSAIKASTVDKVDGISLLGTSPHINLIPILERYSKVFVWLDRDEAGENAINKVKSIAELSNSNVSVIINEEPKKLNKEEICSILTS